ISGHAATQATGFGLLTWQVYLLLKIPAFAGHTTRNSELSLLPNASKIEPSSVIKGRLPIFQLYLGQLSFCV
ncbi:MAG: hypothetical protein MI674_06285, partial [Cytophagales bacterium]|nr:hypothetical protein [Cytophagales bacterium]